MSFFIPPGDLKVRIKNVTTQNYLYADHSNHDDLSAKLDSSPSDTTELWVIQKLQAGGGSYYAITNIYTDAQIGSSYEDTPSRVPWMRSLDHPTYTAEKDDTRQFRLEPSASAEKQFRIINVSSGMPLTGTGPSHAPGYMIYAATSDVSDDQMFVFEYGDLIFDHIEYHVDQSALSNVKVDALATGTAENNKPGSDPQTCSIDVTGSVSEESSWSLSVGITVSTSVSATIGIPEVADGTVTVGASVSTTFTFGETITKTMTIGRIQNTTVKAGEMIRCTMTSKHGHMDLPFDAVYNSKESGTQVRVPGIYKGTPYYDTDYIWS